MWLGCFMYYFKVAYNLKEKLHSTCQYMNFSFEITIFPKKDIFRNQSYLLTFALFVFTPLLISLCIVSMKYSYLHFMRSTCTSRFSNLTDSNYLCPIHNDFVTECARFRLFMYCRILTSEFYLGRQVSSFFFYLRVKNDQEYLVTHTNVIQAVLVLLLACVAGIVNCR